MNTNRRNSNRVSIIAGAALTIVGAASTQLALAANLGGALGVASSTQVSVNGMVKGKPEAVSFSGPVTLRARTVADVDMGSPSSVELTVDLSTLKGKGLSSGNRYVTKTREVLSLPLSVDGTGQIAVDFPYQLSTAKGVTVGNVGHASFSLVFNLPDGTLASGRGRVSTPAAVPVSGR